ncbi:hypothetical protein C8Q78DRAFT_983464 [Trametes maxima]|nr:hypothetical protein C8Q78DRAFT_983464 [Trametes maxima]
MGALLGAPTTPPFKEGRTPGTKPKAGDYEPHVTKLIINACHEYEVLIATDNAFPDPATQNVWATRVWTSVCSGAHTFYKLTDRIEKLITDRGSHARGELRDKIRPHIVKNYGFNDDGSERAKVHNLALYHRLLDCDAESPDPAFIYKNVETRYKYAHNAIILDAIKAEWFADANAPGIRYPSQFSPLRDVTIALLFTMVEYCLDRWANGCLNKSLTFTQKAYEGKYLEHLARVRDWVKLAPESAQTICQRIYDRARKASGATPLISRSAGLPEEARERLRLELAAQAAAPDSDDENGS